MLPSRWRAHVLPPEDATLAFALSQLIRDVVDDYPYLAMDTEFPGVVARPVGNFKNSGEYHYQTLRCRWGAALLSRSSSSQPDVLTPEPARCP